MRIHPHRRTDAMLAGLVALATLIAGCSALDEPAPTATTTPASATPIAIEATVAPATPTPTPAQEGVGVIATVLADGITTYDGPDGNAGEWFGNPNGSGAPLVFMVMHDAGEWFEVQLPIRPNGATGWIRADEVSLATARYSIEVSTADHSLTLRRDGEVQEVHDAAIGTGDTPTPTGHFFITELLKPTNAGYGDYAYGLSAFSEVLNSFGGGPGQIGIHGTDDESTIGTAVSHGCVRLTNADISYLASILPLGTPVTIT